MLPRNLITLAVDLQKLTGHQKCCFTLKTDRMSQDFNCPTVCSVTDQWGSAENILYLKKFELWCQCDVGGKWLPWEYGVWGGGQQISLPKASLLTCYLDCLNCQKEAQAMALQGVIQHVTALQEWYNSSHLTLVKLFLRRMNVEKQEEGSHAGVRRL